MIIKGTTPENTIYSIEMRANDLQTAMHFFNYARRHGFPVKVIDFTDEENELKEVAKFNGIPR